MAIPFIPIRITSPLSREKTGKYYARVKTRGEIDLREFADKIADISTLSVPDTVAVLEALVQQIPEMLLDGYRVKLGDLGVFTTSFKSDGAETSEDCKKGLIRRTDLLFKPSKYLKKKMRAAEFERVRKS